MARLEAQQVGFDIPNFQLLTTILFRALQMGPVRASQMLQPLNHQMPRTQVEYDRLLERIRSFGHLADRSPGNIGNYFAGMLWCSEFVVVLTGSDIALCIRALVL